MQILANLFLFFKLVQGTIKTINAKWEIHSIHQALNKTTMYRIINIIIHIQTNTILDRGPTGTFLGAIIMKLHLDIYLCNIWEETIIGGDGLCPYLCLYIIFWETQVENESTHTNNRSIHDKNIFDTPTMCTIREEVKHWGHVLWKSKNIRNRKLSQCSKSTILSFIS